MNNLFNIVSTNFCDSNNAYKLFSFLGKIFNIIKIVVPIIIILYAIIDLVKSMVSPEDKSNIKLLVKRLIYGVAFFFLISIVTFIFSLLNNKLDNKCMEIFLNPNDTNINKVDVESIKDKNQCQRLGKPYIWINNECRIDISSDRLGV